MPNPSEDSESLRVAFRPLTEADLPLLCDWLNRPHLQRWWRSETVTLVAVREKYLPRLNDPDAARPYLACLGEQPMGYIQAYHVTEGADPWWPDAPGPGVRGIDQFLADGERLGRGLGRAMVSQFAARLFDDPAVAEIRVDPHPDNERAIRCYASVGFQAAGPITTPDGPALMMVLGRQALRVHPVPPLLTPYSRVRVRQVVRTPDQYDGWRINRRPPAVGDVGTIVEILHAPDLPPAYVVEMTEPGTGTTLWLGDFHADELDPLF